MEGLKEKCNIIKFSKSSWCGKL